ncbi:MAG TPA: DarT ssDNA thymidine ADP-ribosyltransferase family protein [Candidatus Mcinerneyibacterium sp.]|nr:DarT ssDNA thymidine ADP-ribosyltransferase family protein [Candidatus Mcinerneyibacterium sp.]
MNILERLTDKEIKRIEEELMQKEFNFYPSVYKLKGDDHYKMPLGLSDRNPEQFVEFTIKRNIKNLVHFTKVKNLDNILKYGLLSTHRLDKKDIDYELNDKERYDNFKDGIFLSITHPNIGLLNEYKKRYSASDWAVLLLRTDILWEKDCLFSVSNSANKWLNKMLKEYEYYGINNIKYLKKLFRSVCGDYERKNLDIERNMTTDPQAEVIVFNKIETNYIKNICFEKNIPKRFKKYEDYIDIKQDEDYFNKRENFNN